MNSDDFLIINYNSITTKRFGHWVRIRTKKGYEGRRGRKTFINFFEALFGPIGDRWQYQKEDDYFYFLKFDQERDLLIFLLKFKQR